MRKQHMPSPSRLLLCRLHCYAAVAEEVVEKIVIKPLACLGSWGGGGLAVLDVMKQLGVLKLCLSRAISPMYLCTAAWILRAQPGPNSLLHIHTHCQSGRSKPLRSLQQNKKEVWGNGKRFRIRSKMEKKRRPQWLCVEQPFISKLKHLENGEYSPLCHVPATKIPCGAGDVSVMPLMRSRRAWCARTAVSTANDRGWMRTMRGLIGIKRGN